MRQRVYWRKAEKERNDVCVQNGLGAELQHRIQLCHQVSPMGQNNVKTRRIIILQMCVCGSVCEFTQACVDVCV